MSASLTAPSRISHSRRLTGSGAAILCYDPMSAIMAVEATGKSGAEPRLSFGSVHPDLLVRNYVSSDPLTSGYVGMSTARVRGVLSITGSTIPAKE